MHRGAGRAAHDIDRVVDGCGIDVQILHFVENVALEYACFTGGAIVKNAADGAQTGQVRRADLDANAGIFAL